MTQFFRCSILSLVTVAALASTSVPAAAQWVESAMCLTGSTPQERIVGCTAMLASDLKDEHRAEVTVLRAVAAMEAGQLEIARSDIESAIAIDPGNSGSWRVLGQLEQQAGRLPESLAAYSAAVGLDPNSWQALVGRATMFYVLEDARHCLADVEAAMVRSTTEMTDGPRAGALALRGLCRQELGDVHGAIYDLEEAVKIDPQPARLASLSSAYLAADRMSDAYMAADRALKADPSSVLAIDAAYFVTTALEGSEAALEGLEKIARENPDDAGIANMLSWRQYVGGDARSALKTIAPFIDEDDAAIQDTVGHIIAALGQPEPAMEAFRRSVELGGALHKEEYRVWLKELGFTPIDSTDASVLMSVQACLTEKGAGCRLFDTEANGAAPVAPQDGAEVEESEDEGAEEDEGATSSPSSDGYFRPL